MTAGMASQDLSRSVRRQGALITGLVAFIWAAAGSSGIDNSTASTITLIAAAVVTMAVVAFALRGGRAEASEHPRRLPENWRQRYNQVSLIQLAAIGLAVAILIVAGVPGLIPAAVCLIVGIHFFPLARLFDQPEYTGTGALLCVVAALGFAVLAAADEEASRAVVGLGAAITLWSTSFLVTHRG